MQLDLLGQMRERLMAENRQKYQKVKKAPAEFSELQIEAYLKTVAFRREINEVQKAAGGRGVAGVQTSRIASEANREFIFSSSYTGNRQSIASAGVDASSNAQSQIAARTPFVGSVNGVASTSALSSAFKSFLSERKKGFHEDIETYRDEMGRVRMNKRKAMGIHMTRDLQRNLDLMKENEQNQIDTGSKFPESLEETNQVSVPVSGNVIEVSFENDSEQQFVDSYDDVFARMVGDSLKASSADDTSFMKQTTITLSDSDWEEGLPGDVEGEKPVAGHTASDESEVEWEEGPFENPELGPVREDEHTETVLRGDESEVEWEEGPSGSPELGSVPEVELVESVSKGDLLEELDFQEAIRLSMEEMRSTKEIDTPFAFEEFKDDKNVDTECAESGLPNITSTYADEIKISKAKSKVDSSNMLHGDNCGGDAETPEPKVLVSTSPDVIIADARQHELKSLVIDHVPETLEPKEIAVEEPKSDFDAVQKITEENNTYTLYEQREDESGLPNITSTYADEIKISKASSSLTNQLDATALDDSDLMEVQTATLYQSSQKDDHEFSIKVANDDQNSEEATGDVDMVAPTKESKVDSSNMLHGDNCGGDAETPEPKVLVSTSPDVIIADARQHELKSLVIDHVPETLEPKEIAVEEPKSDFDAVQKITEENNTYTLYEQREDGPNKSVMSGMSQEQVNITKASLEDEMKNLDKERYDLGDEQRRLERNAESVSGEMFTECQELLQMFGLPYIIAPMEAEAQCAYMELENLVDGVVTDDSDVLLFGARSVYKNIFDDRKYVETYFMKDIESELGLTREKLIRMAMLLGSDYTEGISGIGIVNAVEVLNAFPEEDGLQKFREWIESPDPSILGKVNGKEGSSTRKRGSNTSAEEASTVDDDINRMKQIFMDKHRNVSKNWHIPATFPSDVVISAYASPQVDKSTEPFSWGKPDLFVLRKLCFEKFGWGSQKADELLQPVLKEYNKHETQLRLEAFYTFNERFAKIRSKRISKAVKGIAGSKKSMRKGRGLHDQTSSELSGSGIHPDNAVLDKDWCQNDANGPAAELSEDYLKMGGGFCADEEGDKEPGKSGCSPLTEELTEASNLGEAEASISPNAAIDLTATASLETNKVNDVIRPVTFLSAMPNLRRKRKKV
nr:DNA repair protein UVH3 isoform X1 [Tanacetum cinerariifolium]